MKYQHPIIFHTTLCFSDCLYIRLMNDYDYYIFLLKITFNDNKTNKKGSNLKNEVSFES